MTGSGLTKFLKIIGVLSIGFIFVIIFGLIAALISAADTVANIFGAVIVILVIGCFIYFIVK